MVYLVIGCLLVLPVLAVQQGVSSRMLVYAYGHWAAMVGFTYWMYADDKRRAGSGDWRVPEMRLHALDLFGGWPGGLLAQRRLRHKSAKGGFQVVFWATVLVWQVVALDSLLGWGVGRTGMGWVTRFVSSG